MNAFERVSLAVVVLLAGASAAQATTTSLDACSIAGLCDQVTITTTLIWICTKPTPSGTTSAHMFETTSQV